MKRLGTVGRWARGAAVLAAGLALVAAPMSSQARSVPSGQIIAIPFNAGFPYPTAKVVILKGNVVTFRNFDIVQHNVVSDTGLFTSPLIGVAKSYSIAKVALLPKGTYKFHCFLHQAMKGALIIK